MPWQVEDLVLQVQARTEHRADEKLDLRMEFFLALDEFCNERHFWWRNKRFVTNALTVGQPSIDIGSLAPDFSGQFDEVYLLDPTGLLTQGRLRYILDPGAQIEAFLNNVQDTPASYFLDSTTSPTTIQFQAPSNVTQKLAGTYWASPMVTDTAVEQIPLIPGNIHYGLTYALERRVYEFLYGQDDPRWTMANQRYEEFITKASRIPHPAGGRVREMSIGSDDSVVSRASGSSVSSGSSRGTR